VGLPQVELREVTPANFAECIGLKVLPEQQAFVATNVYSLAEAKADQSLQPRAVYAGDDMVGFVMYGRDPSDGRCWVVRLMVDHRYQGRGYGRAAMLAAMEALRAYPDCHEIWVSYEPHNSRAQALYRSLGFEERGMNGGETAAFVRV